MTALRLIRIVGLSAGLLALPACRVNTQPVMNVERPIYKNHGQLDLDTIREKIVAGLDDKGWGVVEEAKGWMVAEVRDDEHWARVRITYDEDEYSIIHFESHPDFLWNGSTIHRRYNGWVENLDEAIADQFAPPDDDDDDADVVQEPAPEQLDEDTPASELAAPTPVAAETVAVESPPAPEAAPPAEAPPAAPPAPQSP
jgi:hypothetical protein